MTDVIVTEPGGICLFCRTRECNDPHKCTCDEPCEMPLCMAQDFEVTM